MTARCAGVKFSRGGDCGTRKSDLPRPAWRSGGAASKALDVECILEVAARMRVPEPLTTTVEETLEHGWVVCLS